MPPSVLVIDDDRRIREMLRRSLLADGYSVEIAGDGGSGLSKLREGGHDVVVLDVSMPVLDGLAVCRQARREGMQTPILLLTARGELHDRVSGLDSGADDYLAKPFEYDELAARLRALVRRGSHHATDARASMPERLRCGDLVLDAAGRTCRRGERVIELSRREFDLLELLTRNAGIAIERWRIVQEVWEDAIDIDSNAPEVYVGYLRRKLEAGGEPRLLHTVRGVGYVLREQVD